MVAIVARAAKFLGKDPVDLLPSWVEEVNRAVLVNFGRQDSRSFVIASRRFLEKWKTEITVDSFKKDPISKGSRRRVPLR